MNIVFTDSNNNKIGETSTYDHDLQRKKAILHTYDEIALDSVYIHLEGYKYKWILVVDEVKLVNIRTNYKLSGESHYYHYEITFKKKFGSHDFAKVKSEFESYLRVEKIKSLNF